MPIATFNIPVPPSGDGPAVSIASLVQAKTVVLSGLFKGSYTILANHLGGTFAPVLLFNSDGTEEVRQTLAGAFSEMKVRANAGTVQSSAVTVEVSAIQKVGANMFAPLAALAPGFTGLSPVVDLGGLFPPTGLEDDINVICLGGFEGTITVLGSLDNVGFNPIGTFQASPAQRNFFGQAQVLEFSPLATSDLVRYLRLDVQGRILSPTTVTIGGAVFNTVVSSDTLAGAYDNGTVPTDQTLALTDAHGGGVVIIASGLTFTGTDAFSVVAASGGSTHFLRVGGFTTESHVTQTAAPGLAWNEVDLRASSIALTGPPAAITALAMVHVGRGTINGLGNTVGDAYDLLVDAAPAGLVTLTRTWSLGTVGPVQVGAGLVLGAGLSPPGESDLVLAPGAANVSQANSGRLAYVGGATQRFAVSANGGPYELLLTTGSFPTLAAVYAAGTAPADQTMTLTNAEGGGVVVDGSGGPFTGASSFSVLGAAGNAINFPRLGGIAGAQDRLLSIFVPDEGILDADGKGITLTADAGGSGGAGNHNGGDIVLAPGAGAGTGLAGRVIALGDFGGVNDIVAGGNLEGANLVLGPLGAINGVLEINFSGVGGTIRTDTGFGDLLELQAFDTLGATYATFVTLGSGNPPTCALAGTVTGVTQAPGTSNTTLATTAFVAAAAGTFTQGSVPFGSSTGPLTEDNAELFWDDANKLFGVGTNGPSARLTVAGSYADVAGTRDHVLATATFAPVGGTAAFNQLDLAYVIDQTGGASGRVVGVRIAATETVVGGLHYPIDVFAGAGGVTEIFRLVSDGTVQTKKGLTLGISLAAPGESDLAVEAGATIVSEANTGRLGYLAGGTQQFMVSMNGAAYVPILTGPAAGGFTQGSVPFGSATGTLAQDNANFFWDNTNKRLGVGATPTATLHVVEPAVNAATPTAFLLVGGAHTAMVAGTEDVDVNFNLSATKTWATGAITTQRDFIVQARTYAFAAASTVTTGATLAITGAPIAGANATITNPLTLWVQGGSSQFVTTQSVASAAGAKWDGLSVGASTLTLTGATTPVTTLSLVTLATPSISAASAITISTAATLTIAGAPTGIGAGPATITNPLAFLVANGNSQFSNNVGINTTIPPISSLEVVTGTSTSNSGSATNSGSIKITNNGINGPEAVGGLEFQVSNSLSRGVKLFTNNSTPSNPYWGVSTRSGSNWGTSSGIVASIVVGIVDGGVTIGAAQVAATATSLLVVADRTITATTGAKWNGIFFQPATLTFTGATSPVTTANFFSVGAPTISAANAIVVTDFFTCRIGAATFAGLASATRSWSLGIDGNTKFGGGIEVHGTDVNVVGPYIILATDYYLHVRRTATAAISLNLPSIAVVGDGFVIMAKDSGYNAAVNNITWVRNGADTIENVAGSFLQNVTGSLITFVANATTNNWELS